MNDMNGMDRGPMISSGTLGFLLGAIVGASVALLWAPASGAETRRRLSHTARESMGRAKDTVNHLREDTRDAIQAGRDAMSAKREQRGHDARTMSEQTT
jgi:gas vesicle protein